MFTGIIEEVGKIDAVITGGSTYKLRIACSKVLGASSTNRSSTAGISGMSQHISDTGSGDFAENEDFAGNGDFAGWEIPTRIGDSIAVNGICLTVTELGKGTFTADVMPETISRTSLADAKAGSPVDLERAMPAYGRFGGHIVSGHIDGTGTITEIRKDGNAVWYGIKTTEDIAALIVEKVSIAIDGISLTVAEVSGTTFKVSIIPHTIAETILPYKKVGSRVNLETDIVGKYVKKLATTGATDKEQQKIKDRHLLDLL